MHTTGFTKIKCGSTEKSGVYFYNIAHGKDDRAVEPNRIRKFIGKETTLLADIDDKDQMLDILEGIAVKLENILTRRKVKERNITLKIKYYEFKSITRSITNLNSNMIIQKKTIFDRNFTAITEFLEPMQYAC